jgi:hypothetical protein
MKNNTLTTLQEKAVEEFTNNEFVVHLLQCETGSSLKGHETPEQTDKLYSLIEGVLLKPFIKAISDAFNKGVEEVLDEVEGIVGGELKEIKPENQIRIGKRVAYSHLKSKLATIRKEKGI